MTRIALWLAQHQLKSKKPARRLRALQRLRTALNDAVVALDDKITIALLDHTLTDPESEIRHEAAGILSDLRDVRALPPLIRALSDPHEAVQETAIKGLKKLDDRTAIRALVPKLIHGTAAIQWHAGMALKSLGWKPDTDTEQIYYCIAIGKIKQLASFGSEAVKPLVEILRRGASDKKIAALNVLGEIGDPAAVKPMQSLLRDPDPLVRSAVIYAFERASFHEAAPALIPVLKDTARNVRLAAALALGSLGDAQAVEPLIKLLDDKDWEIRRAALESLGKLGDTRAFPSVARHLDDKDKEVREVAADALGTVGNESIVEKLVFTMVDAHTGVRQAAARALARIYPHWERSDRVKRLLPEIQAAMKHRDINVQSAATSLFQRVAGPDTGKPSVPTTSLRLPHLVGILRKLLEDADAEIRLIATETIGRIKLKECEDDLKKLSGDLDAGIKQAAQDALMNLAAGEPSANASNITFLSKTAPTPKPAAIATPAQDLLICSPLGEVLHQWNCRELAGWLKILEFILPQAEQLTQLMTLGETKRIVIQSAEDRILLLTTADGSVMLRSKNSTATENSDQHDGNVTEATKEMLAEWLRHLPSARGMLMRGIRFPDQTILCDVDSRNLPVASIEAAYHLVADTFHWLRTNRIMTSQMIWSGERTELHCARRTDRSVMGVLASAKTSETDIAGVNEQLASFQKISPR
jgi:HEAT repeat protein